MIPGKTEVALMQVRQGEEADLRQLEEGQFGYATDTGELYIGAPREGRLAGRTFRNLKVLTELNGVSTSTVSLRNVTLETGEQSGTVKLTRFYTDGSIDPVDNIPVRNVLTTDDASDFVNVTDIFNEAIPSASVVSNKVPSLNSINQTLNERLAIFVQTNQMTSDVIATGTSVGDKVTTPIAVDRTISNRLSAYISKAEVPNIVVNVGDLTYTGDSFTTAISTLSTQYGTTSTRYLTFPSATSERAGLITASDYNTLYSFDTRISKLEAGGVWRGSFVNMVDLPRNRIDESLAGGEADLNDFVTVTNAQDPYCEVGQAVFRLKTYDETTGAIPQESFELSTTSVYLTDLDIDKTKFKRHTGVSYDSTIVYTYTHDYNYVFNGFVVDEGVTLNGDGYAVGDIVECITDNEKKIQLEVTTINETDPNDNTGKITSLTFLTPTGYENLSIVDGAVLSDVQTLKPHAYPVDPQRPCDPAAVIKIASTSGTHMNWIDQKFRVIDLDVLGITFTGSPVEGDELIIDYQASGWAFDYWISMNIAIATSVKEGVVKGSPDISKVSVELDGTMTVNSYLTHEQRISANTQAITERVAIAQGVINAGKLLAVNNSGNVALTSFTMSNGIWDYANQEFVTYANNPVDDWNDLPSGIYNVTTDSNTLHSVPGDTGGDFHVTTTTYNSKTIQIAIDMSNPLKQYVRSYNGSVWTNWNYPYASWVPGNN